MSMTTIIVIVIGVVLLILGLTWVRGIFSDVSGISDDAFGRAKDIISGIEDVSSLLTIIPDEIEVGQGKDEVVKVIIANFEDAPISVSVTASSGPDTKLKCGFLLGGDQLKASIGPYALDSGDQKSIALIIKDNKGSLRRTSCNVKVTGTNDPSGEQDVLVRVVKEKELLK